MPNMLAAHTDKQVRALAEKGDKTAHAELVRRGLAHCPLALARARAEAARLERRGLRL
jgi:hypothetical protein